LRVPALDTERIADERMGIVQGVAGEVGLSPVRAVVTSWTSVHLRSKGSVVLVTVPKNKDMLIVVALKNVESCCKR